MLSTVGASRATAGFPLGSVVEYAVDGQGRPIFALSSLSGHTRDLRADPRCSLTVTAPAFKVLRRPLPPLHFSASAPASLSPTFCSLPC